MPERSTFNPEQERLNKFAVLREQVHAWIEADVERRIQGNPEPSEEEILAGAFKEMIEPQVRDAMFEFRRRGYSTESSGFGGRNSEIQAIDGYFEIDDETKAKLASLGVKVLKGVDIGMPAWDKDYTFIQFNPDEPDLEKIKATWDTVAAVLPGKGEPARPATSGGSEDFRKQYAPERTDIEKQVLKLRLAQSEYSPEAEAEMRARLEELSS